MYNRDPLDDFDAWDAAQARYYDRLPKCDYCGEAIEDCYFFHCDEIICRDCMESLFLKEVDV